MDLTEPNAFARVYDEHSPSVYRAAYGIVRDATMAQDVTQDVFLRLWRRPRTFDAGRGEIGSYLRLMARSRALDLWRETPGGRPGGGQAAPRDRASRSVARTTCRPWRSSATTTAPRSARRCASCRRCSARRSCWRTGAGSRPRRSRCALACRSATAKSRIRLGLSRLRDVLQAQPEAA